MRKCLYKGGLEELERQPLTFTKLCKKAKAINKGQEKKLAYVYVKAMAG